MKKILLAALVAGFVATPAMANMQLAQKYACTACHAVDKKIVGPAYKDVAKKYAGQKGAEAMLVSKVKNGGSGVWGPVPMTPHPNIPDADLHALVKWVLSQK
ncbi:c-type cytochrome [Chromobacterium sp. IIBBL 290-4]|uniref:c-type cytochrome n=1 Tax=Chromobacterium sp. IIBBL 290-4 TaxID=2953890 RepID=UPI0020B785D8|nr:c-type cytochrome [Chromobacterium sp. IIBBL 290-4]UTH75776.1 c-type cytochrome [Chromobacterium sp. IIBBL 290-4]